MITQTSQTKWKCASLFIIPKPSKLSQAVGKFDLNHTLIFCVQQSITVAKLTRRDR